MMTSIEINTTYDDFVKLSDAQKVALVVKATEQQLLVEKEAQVAQEAVATRQLEYQEAALALEKEYQAKRAQLDQAMSSGAELAPMVEALAIGQFEKVDVAKLGTTERLG